MSNPAPVLETNGAAPANVLPAPKDDSLGIDRAFVLQMARMPAFAVLWVLAAVAAHHAWAALWPHGLNAGPLVVIGFGMILAAFIDGWALKVPNWITLPLVLSGWALGALHDFQVPVDSGTGGFGMAVLGTVLGFVLLFPMLAIGGVGEGDVKMQMGFGAWVGAYFGTGDTTQAVEMGSLHGLGVVFWAFCFGAIVGGAFGLIMIVIRRRFGDNAQMVKEIGTDLALVFSMMGGVAKQRATERRKVWVKLPYGIPLCVGFILYLLYMLVLMA
ncbi:MAG: prepilin peptidase [Planctomycetes bacterium]|nr:prepilin peptidase [Planctomycetota bacterium]